MEKNAAVDEKSVLEFCEIKGVALSVGKNCILADLHYGNHADSCSNLVCLFLPSLHFGNSGNFKERIQNLAIILEKRISLGAVRRWIVLIRMGIRLFLMAH